MMGDISMNQRQVALLYAMVFGTSYTAGNLTKMVPTHPASATLRRDLRDLESLHYIKKRGEKRGTTYTKTVLGALLSPIDAHDYFQKETDARGGLRTYQHELWNAIPTSFFSAPERALLETSTERYLARSRNVSDIVRRKELERFVIELSWKSSRIEGNTYTLLDTERLLRDGVEASGHTKDEALMIINHKKAFQYILESKGVRDVLDRRFIEDVHRILIEGLGVSRGFRKGAVGITGSSYRPLDIPAQLEEATEEVCRATCAMQDPYSQALIMLVGLSYIQPFEDGNKRTARLIANAVLVANEKAPLSYRSTEESLYRESMLTFYEQLSIVPMKRIFVDQYHFASEQYLQA